MHGFAYLVLLYFGVGFGPQIGCLASCLLHVTRVHVVLL